MNWATIWAAIHGLVAGLGDKGKWKMSIDGVPNQPITAVAVSSTGIRFDFTASGTATSLEAVPGNLDHATVKVNGTIEPDARLVFSLRHQIFKPVIVVFEFENVTVGGAAKTYRFDNPK
jgi:hypothetical protein